jgi:hypothetical protein
MLPTCSRCSWGKRGREAASRPGHRPRSRSRLRGRRGAGSSPEGPSLSRSGSFDLAERSTSGDLSLVRRRRWIVISASGAGSFAASPDALPSASPDPAAPANSAIRSIGFFAALLNSSICVGTGSGGAGVTSGGGARSVRSRSSIRRSFRNVVSKDRSSRFSTCSSACSRHWIVRVSSSCRRVSADSSRCWRSANSFFCARKSLYRVASRYS